jgi:hypothetical protein
MSVCLSTYLIYLIYPSINPSIHLSIHLPTYLWIYSPYGYWLLFQFLNPYINGRTPWTGDQPIARPLSTHRTTETYIKRKKTSMHRVQLEPTIQVFDPAKTAHGG